VQATSDLLKDGVIACKAEISGKDCADAIQKVEAMAAQ
jgi:hypothetical protein